MLWWEKRGFLYYAGQWQTVGYTVYMYIVTGAISYILSA